MIVRLFANFPITLARLHFSEKQIPPLWLTALTSTGLGLQLFNVSYPLVPFGFIRWVTDRLTARVKRKRPETLKCILILLINYHEGISGFFVDESSFPSSVIWTDSMWANVMKGLGDHDMKKNKKHHHQSSIVSLMDSHASVERRSGLGMLHKLLYDSHEIRKLYKFHIFLAYGLEVYLLYWYWWLNRSCTNMAVTAWLWTSGQAFYQRWDSPVFFSAH